MVTHRDVVEGNARNTVKFLLIDTVADARTFLLQAASRPVIERIAVLSMSTSTRARRRASALAFKTADLAVGVPAVMTHRLTRMALSGLNPSAADQVEFVRMVQEKPVAFAQAGMAWCWNLWLWQQQAMWGWMRGDWLPHRWVGQGRVFQANALRLMDETLQPVHQRVRANARRLGVQPRVAAEAAAARSKSSGKLSSSKRAATR